MADSTLWWLLTGGAVAVELVTGTFYLLMLAIGLAAGALAAHAGAPLTVQLLVAAFVGGGAVAAWYLVRGKQPQAADAAHNRDVNLDIGETVQVDAWNPDGTASIKYRG
ncbi:MAG TPA: NfeD family protein, partial [Ramlibacter sp.]|nr:NfeD family protein [Ramlibacter sp.]